MRGGSVCVSNDNKPYQDVKAWHTNSQCLAYLCMTTLTNRNPFRRRTHSCVAEKEERSGEGKQKQKEEENEKRDGIRL